MTLNEIIILSVIRRPGINALWFSATTPSSIPFILLATTLVIILANTFHSEIGLSSPITVGFFFFGISTIFVSLSPCTILRVQKNCLTSSTTSIPTISQCFWKKAGVIPSGPVDISRCIWNSTSFTSYVIIGFINSAFCAGVIFVSLQSTTSIQLDCDFINNSVNCVVNIFANPVYSNQPTDQHLFSTYEFDSFSFLYQQKRGRTHYFDHMTEAIIVLIFVSRKLHAAPR